jgi:hypothetical protein
MTTSVDTKRAAERRDRAFLAATLVAWGALMLADRVWPDVGIDKVTLLALGLLVYLWGCVGRTLGPLVTGSFMTGVGVGVAIAANHRHSSTHREHRAGLPRHRRLGRAGRPDRRWAGLPAVAPPRYISPGPLAATSDRSPLGRPFIHRMAFRFPRSNLSCVRRRIVGGRV